MKEVDNYDEEFEAVLKKANVNWINILLHVSIISNSIYLFLASSKIAKGAQGQRLKKVDTYDEEFEAVLEKSKGEFN